MPVPASPDDKGQIGDSTDLDKRLEAARQRNQPALAGTGPKIDDGMGTGMRSGVEFGAALLISIGIGIVLDRWWHTSPVALLVMLVLGFAAGLLNVYRAMKGMGYGQTYKPSSGKSARPVEDETDET